MKTTICKNCGRPIMYRRDRWRHYKTKSDLCNYVRCDNHAIVTLGIVAARESGDAEPSEAYTVEQILLSYE